MPLHHPGAVQAELHARIGVDAVVDAAVVWHITAGHAGVGGVYDGIAGKGGDVSLSEIDAGLHLLQVLQSGDAFLFGFLCKISILNLPE